MRKLPNDHPNIYTEFLNGHFVVKTNTGSFNGVAPDMKLEQTIQRAQKAVGVCTRVGSYLSRDSSHQQYF